MNNPSELAGLPGEVATAIRAMDLAPYIHADWDVWGELRAELLRFARRVKELERELCAERLSSATANTVNCEALKRTEAELAALNRRIAEAKVVEVDVTGSEVWLDMDDYGGQRVALLPVGGDRER